MDLATALIRAIEEQREQLNDSPIAHGEPGRLEINVNPLPRNPRITIHVVFPKSIRVA